LQAAGGPPLRGRGRRAHGALRTLPDLPRGDGVLYADDELFAKILEESQLWHCYATENFWPALISPATAAD
jgi:hypothetical protein